MIDVAWQVHGWYQENTDTRGMLVPEQCWYQKNAGARGMLTPEKCQYQDHRVRDGSAMGQQWEPEWDLRP
jgi:hypothetical protein